MKDKQQNLSMLKEEFYRWEELLANISEGQITTRQLPSNLSIKDVMAHLRAWQQVTIARLEAALSNREPEFPEWLGGKSPESEEELEQFNARIHDNNRDRPWLNVNREWREGFLRVLELGETIPEKDLVEEGRYPWLEGYALIVVLQGTYEHHHEDHLEPLLDWLQKQGNK